MDGGSFTASFEGVDESGRLRFRSMQATQAFEPMSSALREIFLIK